MSTGVFLNFIARARAALWSADMFLPPQISVHSKREHASLLNVTGLGLYIPFLLLAVLFASWRGRV